MILCHMAPSSLNVSSYRAWIHFRQTVILFSRFYQGKNKLTQIALGKSEEAEYKDGIHKVSEQLIGEVSFR